MGKKRSQTFSTSSRNSKKQVLESVAASPASDSVQETNILTEEAEETIVLRHPFSEEESRRRWPLRYYDVKKKKNQGRSFGSKNLNDEEDEEMIEARLHFSQAVVDGQLYNLEDDAYVQAEDDKKSYICKIIEIFEAIDEKFYFTAQWFYRAEDTVIQQCNNLIDQRRIFFSEIKDVNPINCLVKILRINRFPPDMDKNVKEAMKSNCDYYYDMMYLLPYCSFVSLPNAGSVGVCQEENNLNMKLLDLYSGCGAMSTGLCLGANSAGVKLVTKWAVDLNKHASDSLRLNHPESQVRNESAENFLLLLKEWKKLCASFSLFQSNIASHSVVNITTEEDEEENDNSGRNNDPGEFDVEKVLDICYGHPKECDSIGLYFKIRWKGYGAEYDTWEPIDGLSNCQRKVKEFVTLGYERKIFPLPGDVDVICGGPPCQGISGFNRFRNKDEPLKDEKNKQLMVFMDIVNFLKPTFVLMENVVDLIKFSEGFLGRYGLGRLVGMNYQARLGIMAAGSYGLPQCRFRVFMWGALPTEKLPPYPLPTHNIVYRGVVPTEFESSVVAHEEDSKVKVEKELFLIDAISDLPAVSNDEERDEMPYREEPKTEFQRFIRLTRDEMPGSLNFGLGGPTHLLYDHRPLRLNNDDYARVCKIPKKKGANFRDLKGVRIRPDNKVEWDPNVERIYLPSGKPLIPDYAMTFVNGSSSKPFGRLWWDETVATVVGRAEPHNQVILHPVQNRVLTIRENARLQGFPDYYKLLGPIKERYIQVGNAVAIPVARALGYSLALSRRKLVGDQPVLLLPEKFSRIEEIPFIPFET